MISPNRQSLRVVHASRAGVPLDGVTDAAPRLQSVLDCLAAAGGGSLVVDGPAALGSALRVGSNTRIAGNAPGDGFVMLPGSGGLALRNAHTVSSFDPTNPTTPFVDPTRVVDRDITIEGLTIDGGAYRGAGGNAAWGCLDYAGQFAAAMRFFGVEGLTVRRCHVLDSCAFGVWVHNVFGLDVTGNTIIDRPLLARFRAGGTIVTEAMDYPSLGYPTLSGTRGPADCIHLNGPVTDFTIADNVGVSNDDFLALNADDTCINSPSPIAGPTAFGGSAGFGACFLGPILRGALTGNKSLCCAEALRILSGVGNGPYSAFGNSRIDGVTVAGLSGSVGFRAIGLTGENFLTGGNLGRITIRDCTVDLVAGGPGVNYLGLGSNADQIRIEGLARVLPPAGARGLAANQWIDLPQGTIRDLDLSGLTFFESAGTIGSPLVKVSGSARVDRLRIAASAWGRASNPVAAPFLQATGSASLPAIVVAGVETDRVRNVVQFDGGFTGTGARVFLDSARHLDCAATDGAVRNDSAAAVGVRLGSVFTQGVPTQNTGAGSISTL